ncbi:MAG TPA: sulfurtransferase [Blastocatellia bacterium]|nr:sulfurtransferase [Blastocatellia bacterium]
MQELYSTLVSRQDAFSHIEDDNWAFVDCRFALSEPERGFHDYERSHIPGAVYAHLDHDLSAPAVQGKTGRHPLPDPKKLEAVFSAWGIDRGTQVVAYDQVSGAMAAARLWWLLKWAGHDSVAVLDGGLKHWLESGYPFTAGIEYRSPRKFVAEYRSEMACDAKRVESVIDDPSCLILDARGSDRYRGENETIDPVAGHIPGAASAPYVDSLTSDGFFLPPDELKAHFDRVAASTRVSQTLDSPTSDRTIFYCGSGVTAAHSVLALAHSGKGLARLYPGSWSDWITDPARPVVTGESRK